MVDRVPLVSVVIIFLNAKMPFFEEAIASVFAQTFSNWELLLVDDGSTDDSSKIAKQYAEQFSDRVRYLEHDGHQNWGMSASRNLGIRSAKGQYVAFLDADDVWLPKKLERQVELLESMPEIGMVFGPTQYWFSWTGRPEDGQRDTLRDIGLQPNRPYQPPVLLHLLLKDEIKAPATCGVLIRREVFDEVGGFEESFRGMFEDRAFFAKVYFKVPVFVTNECWDRYRQHPDSTCAISQDRGVYDPNGQCSSHRMYFEWLANYLSQQGIRDSELWNTLEARLIQYRPFSLRFQSIRHKIISRLTRLGRFFKHQTLFNNLLVQIKDYSLWIILKASIKCVYGLEKVQYSDDELIALSVVRNGELHIKSFIEHHFSIGIKHIVFLDNGSTDSTIDIARQYQNITILQTYCPYQVYESLMKKYLVYRFSKQRWNLFVDVDELFDYPFSGKISLNQFLNYLNKHCYTAVVAQMLDLFSDQPLNQLDNRKEDSLKEYYQYYDISNIRKTIYPYGKLFNPDIKMYFGGIRKSMFGTDNGLTKAPLTFIDNKIRVFVDCHHVKNAQIADLTSVLLHYPFIQTFYEKVLDAVVTGRYRFSANEEYKKYWEKLKQEAEINFRTVTTCKLDSIDCLINENFLVVSEDYLKWVEDCTLEPSVSVAGKY